MSAYGIFTAKRGRPKSNSVHSAEYIQEIQTKSTDADVLMSLLYLKKISKDQYEAAQYYQKLCFSYQNSIGAPIMHTSSMIHIQSQSSRGRKHSSSRDDQIFTLWTKVKLELARIDKTCETVLYKVIIENKMKHELLNQANAMYNPLRILQMGLDSINKYRTSSMA